MRLLSPITLAVLVAACGAAPTPVEHTHIVAAPPPEAAPAPPFAGHAAMLFRSMPPASSPTQPTFYAELAADGSVAGARCGATRFTDEGVLEREGVVVARIVRVDGALGLATGDGTDLGWRIDGSTLLTREPTRFTIDSGTITPSDPQLPAIGVAPASTPDALALALFAALLVCDDVGP